MLDSKTFTDPQVVDFLNTNFYTVKVNAEKDNGPEIVKKYLVTGYPTVVYVNPDGTEMDRIVGYLPAADYLKITQDYKNNINTLADYLKRLEAQPNDLELHFKAGEKYFSRGDFANGAAIYDKLFALDPTDTSQISIKARFTIAEVTMYAGRQDSTNYEKAVGLFKDFIQRYPDHAMTSDAYQRLARCFSRMKQPDNVVATYREAIKKYALSGELHNAYAWYLAEHDLNLDEALQVATKATELSPKDPQVLDTVAEVYFKRKEYDKAIETINKAIEIDPEDTYLKEQLDKFQNAKKGVASS